MKILSIIVIITIFWDSEFAFGLVLPNGYHHINRKILVDGGTDSTFGFVTYGTDCAFTRISGSQVVTATGCKAEYVCKTSRRRRKRQDEPATDAPAEGGDGAESSAESNADTESSSPEADEAGASEEPVEGVEEGGGGEGEPDEGVEPGDGGEPEEVQPEYQQGGGEVEQAGVEEVGQEGAGEVEGGDVGGGAVEEGGGYGEAEQIPEEKAAPVCVDGDQTKLAEGTDKNGVTVYSADGVFSGEIIGDDKFVDCKAVGFGDKDGFGDKKTEIALTKSEATGDEITIAAATAALCGGDSGGAVVCGGKLAGIIKRLTGCVAEATAVKVSVLTSNSTSEGGGSSEATQHLISPLMVITLVSATIGIMFTN